MIIVVIVPIFRMQVIKYFEGTMVRQKNPARKGHLDDEEVRNSLFFSRVGSSLQNIKNSPRYCGNQSNDDRFPFFCVDCIYWQMNFVFS
jgi:hypothetical protein